MNLFLVLRPILKKGSFCSGIVMSHEKDTGALKCHDQTVYYSQVAVVRWSSQPLRISSSACKHLLESQQREVLPLSCKEEAAVPIAEMGMQR